MMEAPVITGIQQIGIGVSDAAGMAALYSRLFGMSALVFDDEAEARLMMRYTGSKAYKRQAKLTMNKLGGGGFEIWQFLNRRPTLPAAPAMYGAPGIYAPILKCRSVAAAHAALSTAHLLELSPLHRSEHGMPQCWATDPAENSFLLRECPEASDGLIGGVTGAVIGVRNMDASLTLYRDVLGISELLSDISTPDGFRKVLLRKAPTSGGAFSKWLGAVYIELVQPLSHEYQHLYAGRYWGDPGYIHLCFDVPELDRLARRAKGAGFGFTVDSGRSFAMEGAAGRFAYLEDPDGTLIELVETHRLPIAKKLGLYLNVNKGFAQRPLPMWMLKLLALRKVKPVGVPLTPPSRVAEASIVEI